MWEAEACRFDTRAAQYRRSVRMVLGPIGNAGSARNMFVSQSASLGSQKDGSGRLETDQLWEEVRSPVKPAGDHTLTEWED